jgi:hypothetical protein
MPAMSMFHGLIIQTPFMDTRQQYLHHIHVEDQGMKAPYPRQP